jgi:hypothetical protein
VVQLCLYSQGGQGGQQTPTYCPRHHSLELFLIVVCLLDSNVEKR